MHTKVLGDILGPGWKVQTPGQVYAQSLRREAEKEKSPSMKKALLEYADRAEQSKNENN